MPTRVFVYVQVMRRAFLAVTLALYGSACVAAQDEATSLFEDARARVLKGDYAGAVVQLKHTLQINNQHLPARIILGEAYLHTGQSVEAEKELKIALQLGADPYAVFGPLGNALLLQRKYRQMLELINDKDPRGSQHFDIRTLRGRAHYELGELKEAENEFQAGLELSRRRAEPLLGLALVADARGDHEQAQKYVLRALDVQPDNAEAWYQYGEIQRVAGQISSTLSAYDKALTLQPNHMRAHLARANLLVTQNEFDKALDDAEYVHKTVPHDAEASFLIWQIAMLKGDRAKAKSAADDVFGTLSTTPEPVILHSVSLMRIASLVSIARRDYERGQHYLSKLISVTPNNHAMRKLLGEVQMRVGDYKSAASTFFDLSKMAPNDAAVFASLGQAYLKSNHYSEATMALERAASLAHDQPGLTASLALSKVGAGDVNAGLSDLAPTVEDKNRSPETGVLYAMLLLKSGNGSKAETTMQTLDKKYPRNAFIENFYGSVLLKLNKLNEARQKFESALSVNPKYFAAAYNLAQLDLRESGANAANKRLQKILDADPKFAPAMDLLSEISLAQGHYEDALRWLQKAVSAAPETAEQQMKLIQLFLKLGKANDALLAASSLADKEEHNVEAIILLASVQHAAGKKDKALESLQHASREAGLDAGALRYIAAKQIAYDDFENARRTLQKALAVPGQEGTIAPALVRLDIATADYPSAEARIKTLLENKATAAPRIC